MQLVPGPLLWSTVTLAAYVGAVRMQRILRGAALANPVLIAILMVAAIILATRTRYQDYFGGARFIDFLLGPATVALAVPLAANLRRLGGSALAIGASLLSGATASGVSAVGLVWLFGGSRQVALSMAPKATTTPIAIAVSQQIGGIASLTAVLAILGGIIAATVGPALLRRLRIEDWRARGLAAGVAGSGVAAAQIAVMNETAAAFAAMGIALNGVATALLARLVPMIWR
jgi:putative effector of murein hydrolase